jgi:hypothetical protein
MEISMSTETVLQQSNRAGYGVRLRISVYMNQSNNMYSNRLLVTTPNV